MTHLGFMQIWQRFTNIGFQDITSRRLLEKEDSLPCEKHHFNAFKFSLHSFQQLLRPGCRLISINTNVCNNLNFFLLLNFDDPWHHLYWIYKVLHQAEQDKETVVIIGHIPPGRNSCFSKFCKEEKYYV